MARYRRRRYRRRGKGKWSANISEINNEEITASPGNFSGTTTLTTNPVQTNTTVSQIYTVKNFEVNFTVDAFYPQFLEGITCYIMYVPQGMNVSESYHIQHPEYIMTYKYLGSPSGESNTENSLQYQNYQPFRIKTRMARRLQTGDSVILFIKGYNQDTTTRQFNISGLIRWWTKAN